MSLIRLILQRHRMALITSLLLSMASAGFSVSVIAFINERLLVGGAVSGGALLTFAGLLVLLFAMSTTSQLVMSRLGHNVVYGLRRILVKRVMDTQIAQIESIGAARILASLSSDTSHIASAFLSLPHAVYGGAVCLGAFGYLAWLSLPLFTATLLWLALTVAIAYRLLLGTQKHFSLAREVEDELLADYQAVIDGRKELALNRARARMVYEREFELHAQRERDHAQSGDRWNSVNENFVTVMTMGAIGLAFFLADRMQWASTATAATYGLTILFIGTPLATVVASVPALISGDVALRKVEELELEPYTPAFLRDVPVQERTFQELALHNVRYRYPTRDGEAGFEVGPLSWSLRRGEIVFVIGGNGSGKSTLARLLSGLCEPSSGELRLDGEPVEPARYGALRGLFSAVFSDFHLFAHVLGAEGPADCAASAAWLSRLALTEKVSIDDGRLSDLRLSTGQRKRLALLLGVLEDRPILLLDEWAADQDPVFRRVFYLAILPQLRAAGRTIVAITHDEAYFGVADRILKLDAGRLVEAPPLSAANRIGLAETAALIPS
ncbi:MAG TPA: multidrug ABC transporter permease/ATP-binding protein [Polyangiales bacterium]|nr:multidrug ABC transporter permease/ATP-binding protein [Polyangiales bacterium]